MREIMRRIKQYLETMTVEEMMRFSFMLAVEILGIVMLFKLLLFKRL